MSVKVVIVDGGGVLLTAVPNPMLKQLAKRYPEQKDIIEKAHTNNPKAWNGIKLRMDYTEEMYFKELLKDANVKETWQELSHMVEESINVYEDVLEICKKIKDQGIQTGILSNHASNWFAYLVKKFKLGEVFQEKKLILVSQEVGIDKPDKEVYEELYKRCVEAIGKDLKKEEIVFVDDKKANVEAAIKFGMKGIQFDHLKENGADLISKLAENGVVISQNNRGDFFSLLCHSIKSN